MMSSERLVWQVCGPIPVMGRQSGYSREGCWEMWKSDKEAEVQWAISVADDLSLVYQR